MLFINMIKLIIDCIKDCEKNKEFLYLNYWDVSNLYGWAIPQKLSLSSFKVRF